MRSDLTQRDNHLAELIHRYLNDAVLGFFALISLFLMIIPSVFEMSAATSEIVLVSEYAIIALFALEYGLALSLATDKRAFVLDRWRVIDAIIIAAALVAFFPFGPDALRNSPALRLARLARFAYLGTRSGIGLKTASESDAGSLITSDDEPRVSALSAAGGELESISWGAGLARINASDPDWIFFSGVSEDSLAEIADGLAVPRKAVSGLFQSSVPRFDKLANFSTLFVRYPLSLDEDGNLFRTPVLLVGTSENVVVLSREHTDLEHRVEARLATLDPKLPRMVGATVALTGEIVRAYTGIVESLEIALIKTEAEQESLNEQLFLRRTFFLRSSILRTRSSLKYLKRVLLDLAHGRVSLAEQEASGRETFRLLADATNDLYDGIDDLKDSLQSLVDLRLNVSSFQMNRVMRLLALLTALALIPATAGGLLGMNLSDTPWPGTLAQVSFGVAAGMALSLYVFAVKGWLR